MRLAKTFETHCRSRTRAVVSAPRLPKSVPNHRRALARVVVVTGAAGLATLLYPSAARASGFASARFGGEHGNVTETNPTALYYNPAGIGLSDGTHLYVDGVLALRHATWDHAAAGEKPDPVGGEGANTGHAQLFNVFGGPMVGATTKLGNLALGASLSIPFGGRSHWSKNDKFVNNTAFPLAADGVQRWHSIDGALTFLYFTVGAAYRFGPLSIGVSGNLISSSLSTTQAKNPTGAGDIDTEREGRVSLDVSGWHGSFALGAALEPIEDKLWIGLSYQAQPALGPMQMTGTLSTTYKDTKTSTFPVTFNQALPDIVRLGARYRPSKSIELRLTGDLTRWSVMQSQCVALEGKPCAVFPSGGDGTPDASTLQNVRRKWQDTYGVRAGVSYWFSPRVEAFVGAGYETAAVPDSTLDPGLPDADNVAASLGGRFEVIDTLFIGGSYTHIQYFDRDNTGHSELANADLPTRRADGGGQYTSWLGIVNLNIEKTF